MLEILFEHGLETKIIFWKIFYFFIYLSFYSDIEKGLTKITLCFDAIFQK